VALVEEMVAEEGVLVAEEADLVAEEGLGDVEDTRIKVLQSM
jgi:hypothetical protein